MTETDTEIPYDMPCEPRVHTPKASLISRGAKSSINSFEEICVIQELNKAKFPVYLVKCQPQNKHYAMKLFPFGSPDDSQAKMCFQNEVRFLSFNHPNIIKTVHFEQTSLFPSKDGLQATSYTLMEYAPHGDFHRLLTKNRQLFSDEKLVRTYFKQLISGLEYIHNRDVAHLDIKPENILLDENFSLKITDFDLSAFIGEESPTARGTKFYRAPEILLPHYKTSPAADIYSAGIILFLLKSGGILPHSEEMYCEGINLFDVLNQNKAEFWNTHCKIQHQDASFYSEDFRNLINSMLKSNPEERATIQEIKASKWYNGSVYTEEELKRLLRGRIRS